MRLLLDADLSPRRIGDPLEQLGHDIRALASEAALEGLPDEAVLELATAEERILVTRNSRHFAPLARTWAEGGREHAGLILIWLPQSDSAAIVEAVRRRLDERPDPRAWRGLTIAA